jgi:hypothetical protein
MQWIFSWTVDDLCSVVHMKIDLIIISDEGRRMPQLDKPFKILNELGLPVSRTRGGIDVMKTNLSSGRPSGCRRKLKRISWYVDKCWYWKRRCYWWLLNMRVSQKHRECCTQGTDAAVDILHLRHMHYRTLTIINCLFCQSKAWEQLWTVQYVTACSSLNRTLFLLKVEYTTYSGYVLW